MRILFPRRLYVFKLLYTTNPPPPNPISPTLHFKTPNLFLRRRKSLQQRLRLLRIDQHLEHLVRALGHVLLDALFVKDALREP